ncbi:hypothetical protein MIDIC_240007 [Alphaproteobacteria bacterium]
MSKLERRLYKSPPSSLRSAVGFRSSHLDYRLLCHPHCAPGAHLKMGLGIITKNTNLGLCEIRLLKFCRSVSGVITSIDKLLQKCIIISTMHTLLFLYFCLNEPFFKR